MLLFNHSGRFGDLFYSLYAATQYAKGQPFDLHLHLDVHAYDLSNRPVMMAKEDTDFLVPLLEVQPYIHNLTISRNYPDKPFINLDAFRQDYSKIVGKEIRSWYYEYLPIEPVGFDLPVLFIPVHNFPFIEKIAICFTKRYKSVINLRCLKKFKDLLIFVGLPDEHEAFCEQYFPVEYHKSQNLLDLMQFVHSCKGFVGNVSGLFAAMECCKMPRVLCLQPSGGDVRCYGDNGTMVNTPQDLVRSVEALLVRE